MPNKGLTKSPATQFNLINQVNPFNSMFNHKPLDDKEEKVVAKILIDNVLPSNFDEKGLSQDIIQLQRLTSEINAIGKQGILLMGERIVASRELFKRYSNRAFCTWLDLLFGTRRTGFNIVNYYELYKSLPDDACREKLKKIPNAAVYVLASRKCDITTKVEIINNASNLSHKEPLSVIKDNIPIKASDKRKPTFQAIPLINALRDILKKISLHYNTFDATQRREIERMITELRSIAQTQM